MDEVPPGRASEHIVEDRFNLVEVIAHLADWEQILLDRITLAVEKPGSTIEVYDESARAIEKHYATRDIHHELEVFANRRRDTVAYVESLTPEQLESPFIHPENGPLTVSQYLAWISGHDLYHIEQATWYFKGTHARVP